MGKTERNDASAPWRLGAWAGLFAIVLPAAALAQAATSQIPPMPPAMPVPQGPALFYGAFNMGLTLVVVALLVREASRTKSALPFAFIVGACIAGLVEPIFDGNIHVTFAQPVETASWLFYNVPYPWYVIPGNAVLAGPTYWMYRKFRRGASIKEMWAFFLVWWAADAFQEVPGTMLGFFEYYGSHPFKLFGWPAWIGMNAGLGIGMAGYLAYALEKAVKGLQLHLLVAVLLAPVIYGSEVTVWPMWITLNGGKSVDVTAMAAVISFVFALCAYQALMLAYQQNRAGSATAEA